jgi:hypothetical protein
MSPCPDRRLTRDAGGEQGTGAGRKETPPPPSPPPPCLSAVRVKALEKCRELGPRCRHRHSEFRPLRIHVQRNATQASSLNHNPRHNSHTHKGAVRVAGRSLHAVKYITKRSGQGGRRNAPGPVQASPPCGRIQSKAAFPLANNTATQTDRQRSSSSSTGGLRSRRTCVDPDVVVGSSKP